MHDDEEATMDEQAGARLEMLRKEFELGQKQLAEVEAQRAKLTEAMLRISGAIQVLEELLGERPAGDSAANGESAAGDAVLRSAPST
jgi:hypothetical protein